MTTIAYSHGVLAFDELVTTGTARFAKVKKSRAMNGFLVGCAGETRMCMAFMDWLEAHLERSQTLLSMPKDMLLGEDDYPFSALVINRDGRVFSYDGFGHPYEVEGPFFAIGSGRDYAVGAMDMGATAKEAVSVAIKWDVMTGGEVQSLSLADIPEPKMPDNVVMLKERRKVKRGK